MSKKLATFNQKDKTNRAATASEIAARFVPSRKYVQLATKTKSINKFIQTKRKVIKIGNFKHLLAIRRELRKAIKQITNNPVTIKFIHIYKELTKTVIRRTDFITKPIKKKLKPPISLFIRRFNQVVDRLGRKRVKWASFGLIGILIVVGLTLGTMTYIHNLINSSYNLPVNEQALIGSPDTALMKSQLTYNSKTKTYYLDKSGIGKSSSSIPGVPSGDNSITVGSKSKSTFSLVIPANIHQGFTTYDKTSGLSFTLTPEFDAMNGKLVNGHLVYPMGLSSAKDVYTIKANGLQENIVYNSAPAETVKLAYKLTLPNTLQAKMMPGGNIGIYSASSYLFGNISYGSAKDQALVAKARLNAAKTNLVFVLPAPEITDNDGMAPTKVQQQTKFSLKGDILTLTATDLDGIHGPLSIDPSIIDATASAFQLTGNNEGDISFANSEVSEAGLSGGALSGNTNSCGSWCASNGTAGTGANLPIAAYFAAAVAYNGYIYQMGGIVSGSATAVVDYAAITATGALAAPGTCPGGTITGDWCASNGTAGTGANLPAATYVASAVVYNGYVYQIGGVTSGATAVVDYAAITATGALAAPGTCAGTITGDWCASTSAANGSLPVGTYGAGSIVYNGYVYEIGGHNSSAGTTVVDYAPIYNGGDIGTWEPTAALTQNTYYAPATTYNGSIYLIGGYISSPTAIVNYAAISSPGDIAPWAATDNLPASTYAAAAVAYNGFVYQIGGLISGSGTAIVDYAAITATGALAAPGTCPGGTITGAWCASNGTAGTGANLPTDTYETAAVAYNGFVYEIGGLTDGGSTSPIVDYAAITATGALAAPGTCPGGTITGDWCASNGTAGTGANLPAATQYASAAFYNGYIYQIGGCTTACPTATNVVDYAAITASGALAAPGTCAGTITGDWCASTSAANGNLSASTYATAVAYNGYIYFMGGYTTVSVNVVDYAAITASGALAAPGTCAGTINGDWCASNGTVNGNLPTPTRLATAVAYNGYIYFMGGYTTVGTGAVDYAVINNGGPATVSTWTESSTTANTGFSLPTATEEAAAVVYNGYIYFMGGYTSAVVPTVDYALLNANGSLGPPSSGTCAAAGGTQETDWCESPTTANTGFSLPTATEEATAVAYNGYIYFMGGFTTGAAPTVDYALLNANGSLGAPAAGTCAAAGGSQNTVWCESSTTANTGFSLPTATEEAAAVVYNGYIYFMGGATGSLVPTVDYVLLNANGSLGPPSSGTCAAAGGTQETDWCESPTTANTGFSLPVAINAASAVAYNGYIYFMGGYTSTAVPTVDYALLNANGSLGPPAAGTCAAAGGSQNTVWCESSTTANTGFSLPAATWSAAVTVYNGYIYLIGGATTFAVSAVYYAPIYNGGSIGPWASTTSLPEVTYYATAVAYNGYIYLLGGNNGNNVPVVNYAAPLSIPRIGFYSILIDMSGSSTKDPTADYLLANGTQTGDPGIGGLGGPGTGGVNINYQFGSNACPTFNSSAALTTSSLVLGTPYSMTSSSNGCSSSSATDFGRWVWVTIKLDDSQTATFPDSSGNHATITGLTLYYHPATNGRLRGGATFSNSSLQSLDAPP